jgi:hypothetical protein
MSETGPDEEFAAFLATGRFMIQKAPDGGHVFYPRVAQPGTGDPLEWVEASGRGQVYATTVVRRKPPEPNYNVAVIDLAEGPRMMGRVTGVAPEDVRIGMPVRARIAEEDGAFLVVFEPAE